MTGRKLAAVASAALAMVAAAGPAPAQEAPACSFQASGEELTDRASPPDSASVRLDGSVVKVCYSSPQARGREIMGDLVPYGQPWRLGANEPTTLHLTSAVEVGGVRLEPGAYALYAVPGRDEWEIVVNGSTDRWGIPIDGSVRQQDVGSVSAEARQTDGMVEGLTLSFERRDEGSADLVVEWERTRVRVPVTRSGS